MRVAKRRMSEAVSNGPRKENEKLFSRGVETATRKLQEISILNVTESSKCDLIKILLFLFFLLFIYFIYFLCHSKL